MKTTRIVCVLMTLVLLLAFQQLATAQDKAAPKQLTKIKLTWSDHIPATNGGNVWIKKYYIPRMQEQLAKVGYELDMTYYHAGTLYKSTEQVTACEQGLVDITIGVMSYETGRAPLHEVLDFGFMGWDANTMNKVWTELNANSPELRAELANFKEIFRFIPQPRWLHHNIKGARVPEDFKGHKIHASGMGGDVFKAIGAVPIRQNPRDWYTSLDRGLFEGISVAFDMVGMMKLGEVLKYHMTWTGENFGHTPVTHLMNRKKFESLPKEVQKVFDDNFAWASDEITKDEVSRVPGYQELSRKKGNEFITLTAEETAKWRAAVKPVHEKWINDMEAKGKPARKVYDEAVRLSKKYAQK
jgi:TRAP-type transport system periplasmic protein